VRSAGSDPRLAIERGSFVHTDGSMAWKGLKKLGYRHKPTVLLVSVFVVE
jgi:hypothetical protein